MCQLVVLSRKWLQSILHGEDRGSVVVFILVIVYLRRGLCRHLLLYHYWKSVIRPPTPASNSKLQSMAKICVLSVGQRIREYGLWKLAIQEASHTCQTTNEASTTFHWYRSRAIEALRACDCKSCVESASLQHLLESILPSTSKAPNEIHAYAYNHLRHRF